MKDAEEENSRRGKRMKPTHTDADIKVFEMIKNKGGLRTLNSMIYAERNVRNLIDDVYNHRDRDRYPVKISKVVSVGIENGLLL